MSSTIDPQAIREESARRCREAGFMFAEWLPLRSPDACLRPTSEIAGRLALLAQIFVYVTAPEKRFPSERIQRYVDLNGLGDHATQEDIEIFGTDREDAQQAFGDAIGWRMENAWPLAWALGYHAEPQIDGKMIDAHIKPIVIEFLPERPEAFAGACERFHPRSLHAIAQLEDTFYCAHNAVRCAQFGDEPARFVPPGFDAVVNGGVIHERRHALTWMLSPGVEWEDTPLDT